MGDNQRTQECDSSGEAGCCPEAAENVQRYADGDVACPDAAQEICDHLAECQPCHDEFAATQQVQAAVKQSCCETAPQDLRDRVARCLADHDQAADRNRVTP